ncbi:MAG: hypothetical protein CMK59_02650 [Proteobacteria bacterium]|nr:hypothetical protein [Pseudomonadota bacterium]
MDLAREAQDKQNQYQPGFQYIELMTGNELEAPASGQQALMDWASSYGMESIPVLDGHQFIDWSVFERDFGTPSIIHIDSNMRIVSMDEGALDPTLFMD